MRSMYLNGKANNKSETVWIFNSLRKVSPREGPIPLTYSMGVSSMDWLFDNFQLIAIEKLIIMAKLHENYVFGKYLMCFKI